MKNGKYSLIIPPADYPGKRYRGKYAYEHHVIYWQNTNKLVESGFEIHHINGNYIDNRFENLSLLKSDMHKRCHARPPKMVDLVCKYCGSKFTRSSRHVKSKIKMGQTRFYCCRNHQRSILP